ncbi:MAG: hypothetical protein ACLFT3_09630 [Cyclobacteriaceae bacterium]
MFKNSRKAYQMYRKLTDEEKAILETKKVSGKHSIREWNRKLSHIAVMDAYADKARNGLTGIIFLSLFLTIFVSLFTLGASILFLTVFVIVLGLSFFGTALFFYLKFKKIDTGNQLRHFIIPTLKFLNRKVRKSHKVELNIDLALPNDEQYKIDQQIDKSPADMRFRKVTSNYYLIPWMQAKIPLADGSLLTWENEDLIRERKVVKRRKNKRKTKYKIKHQVKVKIMLPKSRYQLLEDRQEDSHHSAIQIDEVSRYYLISIKGKQQTTRNPQFHGDEFKSMNPKYFTSLLIKAYAQVEPIKSQTV